MKVPNSSPMDRTLYKTHVKLLAFDLLSLSQAPSSSSSDPISFSRHGKSLSRVEILGTVASRDFKPNKFLKFIIDDGTGCATCILWLNQRTSPYFSRRTPPDVRLIADMADHSASLIHIGTVARVRGKITSYRGMVQITVSDVVIERDPNVEILHWLQCIKLARNCYDFTPPCKLRILKLVKLCREYWIEEKDHRGKIVSVLKLLAILMAVYGGIETK